ncbi:MAG: hypothetical protein AAF639_36935, partial [Chloroflexota bacterium]
GMGLAIAIVYSRTAEMSLMPWAVISQTIPIVAIAPMIIALLANDAQRQGPWRTTLGISLATIIVFIAMQSTNVLSISSTLQ